MEFNIACGANANDGADGREGSHPSAFVDVRMELLERINAELGARLAALEGMVFLLRNRVQELESAAHRADRTTREVQEQGFSPHLAFHPAINRAVGNPATPR